MDQKLQGILLSAIGEPSESIRKLLSSARTDIFIISPYIKVKVLEALLPFDSLPTTTIISRFSPSDVWTGVADIELYPFCQSRGIRLFANNHVHLKAYLRDWEDCISGSSNLTNKGLAITESFNFELNTSIQKIDTKVLIYFRTILNKSSLVTDAMYRKLLESVSEYPPFSPPPGLDIASTNEDKRYLISSLPMTRSIEDLFEVYDKGFQNGDVELTHCAMHDVVLHDIPNGLKEAEFLSRLQLAFFASPFISDLLNFIDQQERYFGEVKIWIQDNCRDVPVPSRRDLTGNIQVLYRWIATLSDGKYRVDRPRHSERIYRAK